MGSLWNPPTPAKKVGSVRQFSWSSGIRSSPPLIPSHFLSLCSPLHAVVRKKPEPLGTSHLRRGRGGEAKKQGNHFGGRPAIPAQRQQRVAGKAPTRPCSAWARALVREARGRTTLVLGSSEVFPGTSLREIVACFPGKRLQEALGGRSLNLLLTHIVPTNTAIVPSLQRYKCNYEATYV